MVSSFLGGGPGNAGNYKYADETTSSTSDQITAVAFEKNFNLWKFWNNGANDISIRIPDGSSNDFITIKQDEVLEFNLAGTGFDHKSSGTSIPFRYLVIE